MPDPISITPSRVEFPGVSIDLFEGRGADANDDRLWMFKSHWYIETYREIKDRLKASGGKMNILEVGIYKGGSAAFMNEFFEPEKLVCLDKYNLVNGAFRQYREAHGNIHADLDVDQSDRAKISAIMDREFHVGLDLIIDDASHQYAPSKATFEVAFPRLRPGGIYILEDWAWSYTRDAASETHYWYKQDALVNLVFDCILCMGARDIAGRPFISDLRFGEGCIWFVRGPGEISKTSFSLDDHRPLRGREMSLI